MNNINLIDISQEMSIINGYSNKKDLIDFNFIDTFSGAGGLSCGLVMSGMKPVASIEIDSSAVETYKYNFIEQKGFDEEVCSRDIRKEEVKQELINKVSDKHIHLITGGFPCQGFSMVGRRVVTDPRNSLYLELLDIVNRIKPDWILMENVVGLRSMLKGEVEKKILKDFKNIGYKIDVNVLNSANYNVPQIRKRVIFIGNNIGAVNYYPKRINEVFVNISSVLEKYLNLKEDPTINHIFANTTSQVTERIKALACGENIRKNFNASSKKIHWDKPSPTIVASTATLPIHPILNRYMTPREIATLQSFPEDFIFKGSRIEQIRQIGNAVPPLMAKAIGLSILKSYQNLLLKNNKKC